MSNTIMKTKIDLYLYTKPMCLSSLERLLLETHPRSLTKNKLVCFHSHIPSKSVMLFHNISRTGTTTTYKHLVACMYAHIRLNACVCRERRKRSGPLRGPFDENGYVTSSSGGCGVSGISITVHLITLPLGLVRVQSVRCVLGSLALFSSSAII